MQFDKSSACFPIKERAVFLNSCGVSPLLPSAAHAAAALNEQLTREGSLAAGTILQSLHTLHEAAAQLFRTDASNVSFVTSTAEALSLIANGYPFSPGDQVISYVHEYPSNHYPWRLQERRGVELLLLPDVPALGGATARPGHPRGWTVEDLRARITPRTRVVALSHVQFTSGFLTPLEEVATLCREHGIDLIIDAAQSLGVIPLYPEQFGVAAVAASGWKWLMGPPGASLLYTSPALREKLEPVGVGPAMMTQGTEYLDHRWAPLRDGRFFEYSTVPFSLAKALATCLQEVQLRYGTEEIWHEVQRLQRIARDELRDSPFELVQFEEISPILSMHCADPQRVSIAALARGVVCSVRGGYLRVAPHFYLTDEELCSGLRALREIAESV